MSGRGDIAALAVLGLAASLPAAARLVPWREAPRPVCPEPVELVREGRAVLACDGGASIAGPCEEGGARVRPRAGDRVTIEGGACRVAPMSAARRMLFGLKVDLNRASAADLAALPGLGAGLAERIVADRAAHGPFRAVEELARVEGVGPRAVEKLRAVAEVGR